MNLIIISRLQAYLRVKAHHEGRQSIPVPPFTVLMNPDLDYPYEGVALPDDFNPLMGYSAEAVSRMCALFDQHGRVPYVQFLDAFAPGLPVTLALSDVRFQETRRLPVMSCTPGTLIHPPAVEGLTVVTVTAESALDDAIENWNINARGFDPEPIRADNITGANFRQSLVNQMAFTARLDGKGVAAGMFMPLRDGVTELAGITTLTDYRRRGIGAALTAYMTRAAFDSGAEIAFLIAANDAALRVYERIGFRTMANLLEYERVDHG